MNQSYRAWSRLAALAVVVLPLISGCKKNPVQAPTTHAEATPAPTPAEPAPTPTRRLTDVAPATPTKPLPFVRGPKLRHPERGIVGEPPPPDPLRERLRQEFEGITENDPKFFETLRRLWAEFTLQEFDRSLPSAGGRRIKAGELLPTELKAVMERGKEPVETLGLANQTRVKEAVRMLQGLAALSGGAGGNHLPSLLESRANQLPPTAADLIAYNAVSRGIQEMNPSTNRPYLELWQPLAQAKNPVYRLLALEAGAGAISANARGISTEDRRFNSVDAPAKVAFFQPYLSEQDPVILTKAVRAMGSLASPDAKAALEQFRTAQDQAGNAELVTAADEALRSCESLLATLKPER